MTIQQLNCKAGDVAQVVRLSECPNGPCESQTLGFTCRVTACHLDGAVPVWAYEGRPVRCKVCAEPFPTLPDANLKPLPGDVSDENECDAVSRREPAPPARMRSGRSVRNAR